MELDIQTQFREIKYLNRQLDMAEKDNKNYSTSLIRYQKELGDHLRVISQLNETNNQLKTLYNLKEKEFFDFMRDFKAKEAMFNAERRVLQENDAILQEQIDKQRKLIEAVEESNQNLNDENTRLKNEIKTDRKDNEMSNLELNKRLKTLEAENAQLIQINAQLNLNIDNLKSENSFLTDRFTKCQKSMIFCENLDLKSFFKGEIVNGLKNGICEEKDLNYHFIGTYDKGRKVGQCTLIENNVELNGNIENDCLNGEGQLKDLNTNKIMKGRFRNGQFTGNTLQIGKVKYNGSIKDNMANGNGYFEFTNDFFFEGRFSDDNPDDKHSGTVTRPCTGDEWSAEVVDGYISVQGLGFFVIDYTSGELKRVSIK